MAMRAAGSEVATWCQAWGHRDFCDYCTLQSRRPVFSFHEEVAYTIAHGAALAGKRAFTPMKAHGFFKAANSVCDSLYSGTLAGFISLVDDRNGLQSDSIVDTLDFVEGMGIPHKVANVEEVFDDILDGFTISERLQLPFALIIDASDLDQPSRIPAESRINPPSKYYRRDIAQHVLCPPFCKYQRDVLRCKLSGGNWKSIAKPSLRSLSEVLPEKWKPVARSMPSFLRPSDRLKERLQPETPVYPLYSPFRLTTASM